jgi:hypothetical protein
MALVVKTCMKHVLDESISQKNPNRDIMVMTSDIVPLGALRDVYSYAVERHYKLLSESNADMGVDIHKALSKTSVPTTVSDYRWDENKIYLGRRNAGDIQYYVIASPKVRPKTIEFYSRVWVPSCSETIQNIASVILKRDDVSKFKEALNALEGTLYSKPIYLEPIESSYLV